MSGNISGPPAVDADARTLRYVSARGVRDRPGRFSFNGGIPTPKSPGGAGLDNELVAEHAQRGFNAVQGGATARVQHPANGLLVDAEVPGEVHARQAAVAKREGKRGLGRGGGGDGNVTFSGAARARYRDVAAADSTRDGLLEGVRGLGQGFGFAGAGGQTLGQVAKRDDELAGGVGPQPRGIGESRAGVLLDAQRAVAPRGGVATSVPVDR